MNLLEEAFRLFDEYNLRDPRSINWNNAVYPQEYAYALLLISAYYPYSLMQPKSFCWRHAVSISVVGKSQERVILRGGSII